MRLNRLACFLVAAFVWAPIAVVGQASDDVYPGESWDSFEAPEDAGYSSEKLGELREYVIDEMHTTGLVVVVGGRVLTEYGDIEELSYLASCRKSILAMLYGKYVVSGKIDLEKTLAEIHFDDNGGLLETEKQATVDHLVTARSGIYHVASNGGDDTAHAPPRGSQKPGTYQLYNNWDFNAAGAVFEMLSGVSIYDALERELAEPIGMQDFDRWRQRKSGNLDKSRYPAYHIWLSTRDMARVGYLMLREGNWMGEQVIPKDWARRIVDVVTPVEEMNPTRRRDGDQGYGYMWWVWDGPKVRPPFEGAFSARGAIGQYITVLPKLDMVVAHKTKAEYRRRTSGDSYQILLDRLVEARIEVSH